MKTDEAVDKLHIAEREVPENTTDLIPVKNPVQAWASQNAYTLIFLSIMFFITWTILVVSILNHWLG